MVINFDMTKKEKPYTPSNYFLKKFPAGKSGNTVNGLGETEERPASPFFWHKPDRQEFGELQEAVINHHRKSPDIATAYSSGPHRGPAPVSKAGQKKMRSHQNVQQNTLNNSYWRMSISGFKGIETTYLLNERAAIIVDSSRTMKSYERGTLINSIDNLETYPKEVVVENIKMKESGYINFSENGRDKILAYVRLNSIGWYYLAVADAMTIESTSEIKTK